MKKRFSKTFLLFLFVYLYIVHIYGSRELGSVQFGCCPGTGFCCELHVKRCLTDTAGLFGLGAPAFLTVYVEDIFFFCPQKGESMEFTIINLEFWVWEPMDW